MKHLQLPRLVSAAACIGLPLLLATADAGAYSGIYVFGDSVSDSGNVALAVGAPQGVPQIITGNSYIPDLPYSPSGRFSNGPVWVEDFAGKLGLQAAPSLAGGTDYAFAGARTGGADVPVPTLTTQASMFLSAKGPVIPSDALYVIAEVGNDARDALASIGSGADQASALKTAAADYAEHLGAIVQTLRSAGAQHFLVFDNVNLGVVPAVTAMGSNASALATGIATSMNEALDAKLQGAAGVTIFDTFSFISGVVQHPGAYGFGNVTDACGSVVGADCDAYAFWDGLHPTAALHRAIADAALAAVPEPQTWAMLAAGLVWLWSLSHRKAR